MDHNFDEQTILIVDDSEFHCAFLTDILIQQYRILIAKSGEDALAMTCSQDPPDLILLDIVMPGMDGYELCKRLKSNPCTKEIPVIFITGKMKEEDEIQAFKIGAVDYISKPFNPIIVKARIDTHMKLKRYKDYLERISYIDSLTQISNRRKFDEYLELIWNVSLREERVISLIMIDIDNFKSYNDIYGHPEGDYCLARVAQALTEGISRKTDFVGRYGGEEFVVVLPGADNENALEIADDLRSRVMELKIPNKSSKVNNIVTISLGVATHIPNYEIDKEGLVELADKALYKAKYLGKNKACGESE